MKVRDIVNGAVKCLDILDEEVFAVETLVAGDCFRIAENAVRGVGIPYLVLGEGFTTDCVSVQAVDGEYVGSAWDGNLVIKISEKEFLEFEQRYE